MKTSQVMKLIAAVLVLNASLPAWAGTPVPAVDCVVEIDQGVRFADQGQKAIIKVALRGNKEAIKERRPPVNLSIVIDRSGSMTGEKLENAKEAAIAALYRLGEQDRFSLVIYAQIVQTIVPAQSAGNREQIEERIRAISPTKGNTAMFGGLSLAAHEIRKNRAPGFVRRIILVSDGKANAGPSSQDDLGRLATALRKERIAVTTVGVGVDYDEDIMTVLSEKSDGNAYFVKTSKDLPEIFAAELGDVLSVVAQDVMVNIDFPEGVTPIGVIGRAGRIEGRNVQVSLNQVYGGQEKYALVEAEIPQSLASGNYEIANAKVTYRNAATAKKETSGDNAYVAFTANEADVQGSQNNDVNREYIRNVSALAVEEAIKLADDGRNWEAARVLNDNGFWVITNAALWNIDEAAQEGKAMQELAAQVSTNGLTPELRKRLRTDSYQDRVQYQMTVE